jgi:hypothetical protein
MGGIRVIQFRAVKPEEIGFVLDSWHKSYCRYNSVPNRYRSSHMAAIREVVLQPTTMVVVVTAEGMDDTILGYVVLDVTKSLVHWMYLKARFRDKYGLFREMMSHIGKELIYAEEIGYTQSTRRWEKHKPQGWVYREGMVFSPSKAADARRKAKDGDATHGKDRADEGRRDLATSHHGG